MMNKKKRRELVERSNSTLKVERPLRKRVKKVELPRKVVLHQRSDSTLILN